MMRRATTAADLMAMAVDHRLQAEKLGRSAEQRELDRVADIYFVLATLDVGLDVFARMLR
jgi:hypothetical protein